MSTIISLDAKEFAAAISWSGRGVARGSSSISESAVSFSLVGQQLLLRAFDGSGYFESKVSVVRSTDDDGRDVAVAIHGPLLASASKVLRGVDARLEFDKDKIVIRTGRSHYSLPTLKATKLVAPATADSVGSILAADFKQAINQVSVAAASDEALVELTGVLLKFSPAASSIRLVACDRYQLAVKDVSYTPVDAAAEDFEVLVPAKELKKLASGISADTMVELHADNDSAFFGIASPQDSGFVNVFSEQFVAYERLMQASFPHRLVVDQREIKSAVSDIGSLISSHEGIFLHFNAEDGIIRVHNAADDSEVEVDAQLPAGVDEDFGFSKEYLVGALNSISTGSMSFEFGPTGKPVIIREVDDNGEDAAGWYHLVMPRRSN